LVVAHFVVAAGYKQAPPWKIFLLVLIA